MILLAVDPGLRQTAYALLDDGALVQCGLVANPETTARGPAAWAAMAQAVAAVWPLAPDVLVIEQQQRDHRQFNPEDMFELAGTTGAIVGVLSSAHPGLDLVGYKPRDWSRVPKQIRHERLMQDLKALDAPHDELVTLRACLAAIPGSLHHNTLDAVCLGRYAWSMSTSSRISSHSSGISIAPTGT